MCNVPGWVIGWIENNLAENHYYLRGGSGLDREGRKIQRWLDSLPQAPEPREANGKLALALNDSEPAEYWSQPEQVTDWIRRHAQEVQDRYFETDSVTVKDYLSAIGVGVWLDSLPQAPGPDDERAEHLITTVARNLDVPTDAIRHAVQTVTDFVDELNAESISVFDDELYKSLVITQMWLDTLPQAPEPETTENKSELS